MFKKLILSILLIISCTLFAQKEESNIKNRQINFFEEAQKALKNKDLKRACGLFYSAKNFDSNPTIVAKSLEKIDSLKVILRKKLIGDITGNWKMITPDTWALREPSDTIVAKMIAIEPNQILFYELYPKAKKWNLVKTEQIIFFEKENMASDPCYIAYANKEVWKYYVDEISGNLVAYYIGQEYQDGVSELVCGNPQIKYFKLQ